jgi:teichuronic acid biosynthesis glycosyltransferase TuaG
MNHLVSIITPLYNSGSFVVDTIESVLSQTYSNWEMIIVNDCSNDNSLSVVNAYAEKDARIMVVSNEISLGAAVSRNTAISLAKGRYIAFLDSDDLWSPDKLENQLEFMISNSFEFTYTAYYKVNKLGDSVGYIDVPHSVSYSDLLRTCSIGCLTVIYDCQALGKIYMPLIDRRQDYALWLRILKIIPKAYGINKPLAKYRVSSNSLSGNKFKASNYQWKVYREIEEFGLVKSLYYFLNYSFHGLIKTYLK